MIKALNFKAALLGIFAGVFVAAMIVEFYAVNKSTTIIKNEIFESDTCVINGVIYLRKETKFDTSYNQYYDGSWYESIDVTSKLLIKD